MRRDVAIIVAHLNGEVYPDKPAFFFWLVAGLMRLGFGFAAGRVLAALAATGTLLLVYDLGRRLYGREVGLMAALVTLTTMLFAWICKLGVLDPPLSFCVVAAIACGHRAFEEGRRRGLWWLAAYAAAGVGVLIKGPVAIAVPAIVLAAYGIARRREVRGGGWWHLAGACLLLAVVAAGMAPSLIQGGEAYAREIVFGQTAQRFTRNASHSALAHPRCHAYNPITSTDATRPGQGGRACEGHRCWRAPSLSRRAAC